MCFCVPVRIFCVFKDFFSFSHVCVCRFRLSSTLKEKRARKSTSMCSFRLLSNQQLPFSSLFILNLFGTSLFFFVAHFTFAFAWCLWNWNDIQVIFNWNAVECSSRRIDFIAFTDFFVFYKSNIICLQFVGCIFVEFGLRCSCAFRHFNSCWFLNKLVDCIL